MPPILPATRRCGAALLLGGALALAPGARADEAVPLDLFAGLAAGLELHGQVDAADLGLPLYPGATPRREPGDDGHALNFGVWGGPFGFRVAVVKLHSADPPATVAAFYREALGRHGAVLDCSQPDPAPPRAAEPGAGDAPLRCGSDRPVPGGQLYKVGQERNLRVVSVEPAPGGTRLSLVRLRLRGD